MRCQEVVSVWDKKINSWISCGKTIWESYGKWEIQNERGGYQIDEITYAKWGLF